MILQMILWLFLLMIPLLIFNVCFSKDDKKEIQEHESSQHTQAEHSYSLCQFWAFSFRLYVGFQITRSMCIYFESQVVCVQTSMEYFASNTDNSQTAKNFLVPCRNSLRVYLPMEDRAMIETHVTWKLTQMFAALRGQHTSRLYHSSIAMWRLQRVCWL